MDKKELLLYDINSIIDETRHDKKGKKSLKWRTKKDLDQLINSLTEEHITRIVKHFSLPYPMIKSVINGEAPKVKP